MSSFHLHERILREMSEAEGLPAGEKVKGVYGLSAQEHRLMVDFLHPANPDAMTPRHRRALGALNSAVRAGARLMR